MGIKIFAMFVVEAGLQEILFTKHFYPVYWARVRVPPVTRVHMAYGDTAVVPRCKRRELGCLEGEV